MRIVTLLLCISTIIQVYKVSIIHLRKEFQIKRRIVSVLMLFVITITCILDMRALKQGNNNILLCMSILLILYVIATFIFEIVKGRKYISVLSVKKAIDLSENGILFLNNKSNIMLVNKTMEEILEYYNITNNYINELIKNETKGIGNIRILKCLDKIWQLRINNNEVIAVDITELYKLQEEESKQNKEIELYNKKIIETLNNIEEIEKAKNLIKIKNEFHDLLGHRLSLLCKCLEENKINPKEIEVMIDNMFSEENKEYTSEESLKNTIKMYKTFGINILVKGTLPKDPKVSTVLFEIIREGITNAIIHSSSKKINIVINKTKDNIEMTIANKILKSSPSTSATISEHEGIKGMRRKLKELGGTLSIEQNNEFILKITI